jgi:hypothetical protein
MNVLEIEKLNELVSRTDMSGNQKVEWLVNFIENREQALSQHDVIESDCGCDGTCHDKITKEYKWCLRHSRL